MYIDDIHFTVLEAGMALQIANPTVVRKFDKLASEMGLSKTAAVEKAVDWLLGEVHGKVDVAERIDALLAQLDRIPERVDSFNPLEWDEHGLPR